MCGLVPIEVGGLAGGEEGADGAARQLQNDLAGLGRGELHGEDAVLEFDGEQFGGGVDDVFRGRRNWCSRGRGHRGRARR